MNLTGKSQIDQARIEWGIRLRFSPMPKLDLDWITAQLNSFRIGDMWQCARTWEVMQERDPELQGSMNKRFEDVASLDWEVFCEDSDEGRAHKAALEYFYNNATTTAALEQDSIGDVSKLIFNIAKAHANFYSVHEMLLRVDNAAKKQVTAEFRECPLWFFEARRGYLGYLEHIFDVYGMPLKQGEWLPAVGYGYMRACSIIFAMKYFSIRDRLLFSQRMGIPWTHLITNAPIGSKEWDLGLDILSSLGNDGAVQTNREVEIKLLESQGRQSNDFESQIDYCNRCYDRMFRGSDLASGSRQKAPGAGDVVGASVQGDEKDILLRRDAKWITPILNFRVDRPIIRYLFNAEPKAWIKILGPEEDDSQMALQVVQFCRQARIPYPLAAFRDKFGVPEPKPNEEVIPDAAAPMPGAVPPGGSQPGGDDANGDPSLLNKPVGEGAALNRNPQLPDMRLPGQGKPERGYNFPGGQEKIAGAVLPNAGDSSQFESNAEDELLKAILHDHQPLLDQVNDIRQIKDPVLFAQRLGAWWDRAQKFIAQLEHDSAAQHTISNILAAGFANGMASKQPKS